MLTQSQNLPSDLCHYLALVFGTSVLQNMLNHIVTILILRMKRTRRVTLSQTWPFKHHNL